MVFALKVVGIGPGSPDYILPVTIKEINRCQLLVGSARALALFDQFGKETAVINTSLQKTLAFIQAARRTKQVGVLVSGDPGFYSLLSFLRRHIPREELQVIPGISSMQIAFSRLGLSWERAELVSLHGRPLASLADVLPERNITGMLLDPRYTPADIARVLSPYGNWRVHVFSDLTYPTEKIFSFDLAEFAGSFVSFTNSVVVIEPDEQ